MESFEKLVADIEVCKKCDLYKHVHQRVIGRGNLESDVLFIGEAPGREEDLSGKAFVGKAGKLLDRILVAAGFFDDMYYISNILKCRPPNNRTPSTEEANACLPFLRRQFKIMNPSYIVCLGSVASKNILHDNNFRITKQRGIVQKKGGICIMPTYHPAAVLRDPSKAKDMYQDIKKVRMLYEKDKEN